MNSIINLSVQGKNNLTDTLYTDEFLPVSKAEIEFNEISVLDGLISVPTQIGEFTKLLAYSENANIKITNTSSGVIDLPISGVLYYNFPTSFSSSISDIDVYTNSIIPVDIKISLIAV